LSEAIVLEQFSDFVSLAVGSIGPLVTPRRDGILAQDSSDDDSVIVAGVKVTRKSRSELTAYVVDKTLQAKGEAYAAPLVLFDVNGQALGLKQKDKAFAGSLEQADIIHVDSEPLVLASRLLTMTPVRERSATTDLFYDFAEAFEKNGISCYFLGASEHVISLCAQQMQARYPLLQIAGYRDGYFDEADLPDVVAAINSSEANILWIGMGKPREQHVALRVKEMFTGQWIVTCGGCFDFASGKSRRAPVFLQKIGLEWLHRLVLNPRRLFWRYLTTNPVALYIALRHTQEIASAETALRQK
jgi:exopolysaccharide biosynthesis WecB/TagA/CpsF family protein